MVLSNQGGLSLRQHPKTAKSDQKRVREFKQKVEAVLESLELPMSVYAATAYDQYRKPRTGMWQEALDDYDLDDAGRLDRDGCLFVGDAGGRVTSSGVGSDDFSDCDRALAANVGIAYHTPEEFFRKEQPRAFARTFDPAPYLSGATERSAASRCPRSSAWNDGT